MNHFGLHARGLKLDRGRERGVRDFQRGPAMTLVKLIKMSKPFNKIPQAMATAGEWKALHQMHDNTYGVSPWRTSGQPGASAFKKE